MSSKLSSLLVQYGIVTVKRMEEAFQRQVIFGGSLDTILLEMNVVDEPTLLRYLYATSGIPPADLTTVDFSRAQEQTRIFPQKLAEKYLIVPINATPESLHVLVTDPPDRGRLDEIGFMLGLTIIPGVVPEFRLYESLEQIYGVKMPLRYAGLVKRLGKPAQPILPVDQEGAAPEAFPIAAEGAPAEIPAEAPVVDPAQPTPDTAEAVDFQALDGKFDESWDNPFAGGRAETLVGMPITAGQLPPMRPAVVPEPDVQSIAGDRQPTETQGRITTLPHAFAPMAQTAAGEIGGTPAEPMSVPEPSAERSSQTAAGEIDLSPRAESDTEHETTPSAKKTALGMPAFDIPDLPEPGFGWTSNQAPMPVPALEPEPVSAPEPVPTSEPEPPPESEPEPLSESEPEPLSEPEPEPLSEPEPEPLPAPEPVPLQILDSEDLDEEEETPFDASPLTFDEAVARLSLATERNDIFAVLLRSVAGYFEYVSVFTVFGDQAVGRLSTRNGVADATRIAEVSVPLTLPSIFRSTLDSKGYYFGPIYDEGINFGLLAEMDRPVPASAFIMPVLIRNRVVCFLYADHGLRPVDPALPESLVFISYQISQAFQRLILKAKQAQYSSASLARDKDGKLASKIAALDHAVSPASEKWQAPPVVSGPVTVRAPQQDGALVEQPEAQSPPKPDWATHKVQPAFPDLSVEPRPEQRSEPRTLSGSSAPPPVEDLPPKEVVAVPGEAERGITSVGYYSLTDSGIQDDTNEANGGAFDSSVHAAAAGELVTGSDATPTTPTSGESPVQLDSARKTASADAEGARTEDIWSLIDDLEKGGEVGDLAGAALQSLGEPALKLVAFRFPGRLAQERMGQHGKLPQPSAHGPLINFMVRMREQGVPYLVELMGSENPEVRYYATFIFSELHAPEVLHVLLDRIFDSAPPVRRVATEVLKAYWQDHELRPVLEHLRAELVGPVPFRRRCAAEVLGALRDIHGVPRLIELAADRDTDTAEAAQRALLLITKQAFGDSRRRWRSWWEKSKDRHRVQWLIDALGHKESECRFLASQELHQLTGETLGYRFDQDKRDREEALARWLQWWKSKGKSRFS